MTINELKIRLPWIDVTEWIEHSNGGGWKHKTATVPDSVSVSSGASIGYGASIGDDYKGSVLCIQASAHQITACCPTHEIQIGCHRKHIDEWLKHYSAIGRAEKYTDAQIAEYAILLKAAKAWIVAILPAETKEPING